MQPGIQKKLTALFFIMNTRPFSFAGEQANQQQSLLSLLRKTKQRTYSSQKKIINLLMRFSMFRSII